MNDVGEDLKLKHDPATLHKTLDELHADVRDVSNTLAHHLAFGAPEICRQILNAWLVATSTLHNIPYTKD